MHTTTTRLSTLAASLSALLSVSCAASATQCVFRGDSAEARLVRFSGEVLSPQGWTVDQQCERLDVVAGAFRVVVPGAGGKLGETQVTRGTLVKRQEGSGGGTGLLHQIAIVLAGDERARSGMSRAGSDVDMLAEALPSGHLVDHGRPLDIDLADPAVAQGATLQWIAAGKAPVRIPVTNGVAHVPAASLHAGTAYEWRYVQGTTTLKGSFNVVSEAAFQEARAAVDLELGAADPDGLRPLAVADRLAERGYTFEARAVLSAYFAK